MLLKSLALTLYRNLLVPLMWMWHFPIRSWTNPLWLLLSSPNLLITSPGISDLSASISCNKQKSEVFISNIHLGWYYLKYISLKEFMQHILHIFLWKFKIVIHLLEFLKIPKFHLKDPHNLVRIRNSTKNKVYEDFALQMHKTIHRHKPRVCVHSILMFVKKEWTQNLWLVTKDSRKKLNWKLGNVKLKLSVSSPFSMESDLGFWEVAFSSFFFFRLSSFLDESDHPLSKTMLCAWLYFCATHLFFFIS